ncbi:MAG: transcription termination factor NusA [Acidimicrobiia bacterium]
MNANFMEELDLLEREKGVSKETILDALANAMVSAYKRSPGAAEEARVTIDTDTGEMIVYGQELDEDGNVVREWEDTPTDFGRIAAQTAKQVIVQRLRDAKRAQIFEIYQGREGDLVTGIVQQSDFRTVMLDLGNAEAVMPSGEKIPYERLERGARVKALIVEVREESKGAPIVVSRSHPDFIRRLFELEVPELVEGIVEIRAIARDAGHRTKIAVASSDMNVDPVGACVGARGSRVRQVVNELRGEKVDIVPWREDTADFIAEALSPAKVRQVILDDEEMEAIVVVPDRELSLAIGKEGQNARLAARLSGYRIDIRSETEQAGGLSEEQGGEAEEKPAEETADKDAAAETAPKVPAAESTEDAAATEAPEPEAAEPEAAEESDDDPAEPEVEDDAAVTEAAEPEAAGESDDGPADPDVVAEDAVVDDSTPGEQPEADGTQEDSPAGA